MELYEKHVILFGLKNLVPTAVVIDAYNRTRKPVLVVCYFGKRMFKFEFFFHSSMMKKVATWINSETVE